MRVLMPLALLTTALAAAPAAQAQNPWLEERVLNIAHQGGEDEFPSNTLYAFKRSVAAGVDGAAAFLLGGGSPGDGVVAFQMPITFKLGDTTFEVTTAENVARAHAAGYAWHTWLSNDGESRATWRTLLDRCVDGVMTARPTAFERLLRSHDIPEACR
jgi:glycerophosphoryl diester phosphodiesterase